MSDSSFLVLANPSFKFEWNGKTYDCKKANLKQVAAFTARSKELIEAKDDASEQKLIAFCIAEILKASDPSITEEFVMENTPGDVTSMDVFISLGFMNTAKFQAAMEVATSLTTESSGPTSVTEPDGLPTKSES